jgi:hypothetical protein
MKIDIPPPTVVRRTAAKAKTEIGDQVVAPSVRLHRLRDAKPPTIVRRIAPKAKTEIGDAAIASAVRIQRLRKA